MNFRINTRTELFLLDLNYKLNYCRSMDQNTTPAPLSNQQPVAPGNFQTPPLPPKKNNIYPELLISNNTHPNRFLAFPILGIFVKSILIIPLFFIIFFIEFGYIVLMILTPFVILFTGKYWEPAYKLTLVYMKFYTKIYLYIAGITDKYPGFGMNENGIFMLRYPMPQAPSRLLAFPLLGFIIRLILLIPFSIYGAVLGYAAYIAVVFSWFVVLFTGRYPEGLYELIRDYLRITNASVIYLSYLSDTYPSFHISMNHKVIKFILIVIAAIYLIFNWTSFATGFIQGMNQAAAVHTSGGATRGAAL